MKYVIIIVRDAKDAKPTVEFDDLKVEYVSVGEQFHGRRFRHIRPTHVIDQTKIQGWYEHLFSSLGKDAKMEVIK